MMKAVVMEISGRYAAVLKNDGTFEKIPNKGYHVGDTIEVAAGRKILSFTNRTARIASAAAAVLLLVSGGAGYNTMVAQAYSYVSVDVNPSIEYAVNRLNRIVAVEALNEDAEEIVAQLKESRIKNKTLTEAMTITGDLLNDSGYISEDDDYVLVNITAGNEKHYRALEEEAQAGLEHFRRGEDVFTISESTKDDRKAARAHNMSAGRYVEGMKIRENSQPVPGAQNVQNGDLPDQGTGTVPADFDEDDFDEFRNAPIEELFHKSGRIPSVNRKID